MASGYYDITNKTLGKGHYGVVKLGRHCLTGEPVAIKIIEKSRLNPDSLNQLGTEIRILFRLSEYEHPNILKLYQTIDTEDKLFLITEYCGPHACDLHDYLSKKHGRDGLGELEAQVFFIQICSAISYCHTMGIVHRDLKPENILVTDYKHMQTTDDSQYPLLKLIDFGFANQWYPDEKMRTSCGTLAYSAPELLLGEPYDGTKVDVWGLGLMLYILLYGGNPFMQINDNETLTKILDCSFATPSRDNVDQHAIELLRALIKRNPETRLSIDAILKHNWFSGSPKVLELMVKYQLRPEQQNPPNPNATSPSLTTAKSLPKSIAHVMSSTTLPSISESGPLKNINRSVDDDHIVKDDSFNESTRPSYNRTRSLSITRTYTKSPQQGGLVQTKSSNNLEKLNSISLNTSPRPSFAVPLNSPLFRPTSPDVRGAVEPTEEENRLHENVLQEIFGLTKVIESKSSIEASLKNARFAHRQFNQSSIMPAQFGRRKISTGLMRLLGQDKSGQLGDHDTAASIKLSSTNLGDTQKDKLDKTASKLSHDDYIYATYQLTRDRILRVNKEKLRRQMSEDQYSGAELSTRTGDSGASQEIIPEEDTISSELGSKAESSKVGLGDQVSAKENESLRLQQRKFLQPQNKMRDKFTSFLRSGSTGLNGSLGVTHELQFTEEESVASNSYCPETHHEAFNDQNNDVGSSVARYFASKTESLENSMAYALPLARKCSLVSEESCVNESQDN